MNKSNMDIEIIGICLVKNEDIYIKRVLKNISKFCDKIRVIDNGSSDNTIDIVKRLMKRYPHISLEYIRDIHKTHSLVERYVGKKKWVFGVDGDEIYDRHRLYFLRKKILQGEYQNKWMLRGYFYHLVKFNIKTKRAVGFLAPPSKDPNKLYNFSLLKFWPSDNIQPLFHCQTHIFKNSKYFSHNYPEKKLLYKTSKWDDCLLRCVHTRMLKRSTKENFNTIVNTRLNLSNVIDVDNIKHNSRKKYRKGKKVEKNVSKFFK